MRELEITCKLTKRMYGYIQMKATEYRSVIFLSFAFQFSYFGGTTLSKEQTGLTSFLTVGTQVLYNC